MSNDDPTTDRARRQQAVASGTRSDAVDRVSDRYDSRGSVRETTSRKRQREAASEIASDIGVDEEGVGTIDRIRGMDVFLRGPGPEQFGASVAEQFASAADFVTADDVAPNVDAQAIAAAPAVASGRRDDVADRARSQTASSAEFISGADLDVEVDDRGVTDLGIAADRRDDVAARARQGLASEDPFAEPGDFGVDVSERGITEAGLTDSGARRRAGRQFESETALSEVDPTRDIRETSGGFGLTNTAERRVAARQFERDLDVFGSGELTADDIRETSGGFGLDEAAAREVGAARLDERTDAEVTPADIDLTQTDDGRFEAVFGGGR